MVLLISTAQRRFLTLASTFFFLSTVYWCVSRLVSVTYAPVKTVPAPILDVDFSKADYPMSYGSHARPGYDDIKLVGALPERYVPTRKNGRRLIVIGDIHGMLNPLDQLLKQVRFDPRTDHVVSVGDMVNKGPKSAEVVQRLMQLNASAVRGNHEDRVLVAWDGLRAQVGVEAYVDSAQAALSRGEGQDVKTARQLSARQVEWLRSLPVVLAVEPLSLYVVHAGLVPGVPIPEQDPWAIMNMRTLRFPREEFREKEEAKRKKKLEEQRKKDEEKMAKSAGHKRSPASGEAALELKPADKQSSASVSSPALASKSADFDTRATPPPDPVAEMLSHPDRDVWVPVDNRDGKPWSDIWNHYQKTLPEAERRIILYGHDAKRGYQEHPYTLGLDSACVKGHALTALVVGAPEDDGSMNRTTIQVLCKAPSKSWW